VAVSRIGPRGSLHLTYTLHAHEEVLRVSATWDGEGELTLDHPTTLRAAPLRVAGELAAWNVPQHADVLRREPPEPLPGLRWARLADAGGAGLLLLGLRPATLSAASGHLHLHVDRTASYALGESARPTGAAAPGSLGLCLGTPARAAAVALPAALRLEGAQVVPWWIRRPDGWRGELLLAHQEASRTRCVLFPAQAHEAARCDPAGRVLAPLRRTGDGDGFELDLAGGEVALVRWR
jgi:hypothetical protein